MTIARERPRCSRRRLTFAVVPSTRARLGVASDCYPSSNPHGRFAVGQGALPERSKVALENSRSTADAVRPAPSLILNRLPWANAGAAKPISDFRVGNEEPMRLKNGRFIRGRSSVRLCIGQVSRAHSDRNAANPPWASRLFAFRLMSPPPASRTVYVGGVRALSSPASRNAGAPPATCRPDHFRRNDPTCSRRLHGATPGLFRGGRASLHSARRNTGRKT